MSSPSDPGRPATGALPETRTGRRVARRSWRSVAASLHGPWRVVVAEASMLPSIAPGDWLLVDPTVRRWPRRGSVVVFREPDTEALAIKRVAAGPGDRVAFADGFIELAEDEAWLASEADEALTAAAGFGPPVDSERFGPVPLDLLVGRAWFRYGPRDRIGRLRAGERASPD